MNAYQKAACMDRVQIIEIEYFRKSIDSLILNLIYLQVGIDKGMNQKEIEKLITTIDLYFDMAYTNLDCLKQLSDGIM